MEKRTAETMKSLAVTTIRSIRQPVATLSGGQRQSVAVARAVMWNSRLVILDEPTAALGVAQTEQVLELVARLAEQGLAVVLISHNLHDVFAVAHRITVLRLGRNIALYEREQTTQQEVVGAITAGVPTKVAGMPRPRRRRRHEQRRAATPTKRFRDDGVLERIRANISAGNLGSWPVSIGLVLIVDLLLVQGRQLLHGAELHEHHHADGRRHDAGLRRRLRPADRRDRPLDQLRRGVGGVVVAQMTIVASSQEVPGWLAIIIAVARAPRSAPSRARSSRSSACLPSWSRSPATRSGRA